MNLFATDKVTTAQIAEIQGLTRVCADLEPVPAFFPAEDVLRYYLYFSTDDTLISILAVSRPTDEAHELECIAYTHPDIRKHGCFTALLEACVRDFPETDLIFPVNHASREALFVMDALEAVCLSTDYRMELDLDRFSSVLRHLNLHLTQMNDESFQLFEDRKGLIGHCKTTRFGHGFCLHHVEIETQYRNKGYAFDMLALLFARLKEMGGRSVFLHVSGSNTAAACLYKKTGFQIVEALSYYLY